MGQPNDNHQRLLGKHQHHTCESESAPKSITVHSHSEAQTCVQGQATNNGATEHGHRPIESRSSGSTLVAAHSSESFSKKKTSFFCSNSSASNTSKNIAVFWDDSDTESEFKTDSDTDSDCSTDSDSNALKLKFPKRYPIITQSPHSVSTLKLQLLAQQDRHQYHSSIIISSGQSIKRQMMQRELAESLWHELVVERRCSQPSVNFNSNSTVVITTAATTTNNDDDDVSNNNDCDKSVNENERQLPYSTVTTDEHAYHNEYYHGRYWGDFLGQVVADM